MMEVFRKTVTIVSLLYLLPHISESAKINTPRVLLPWLKHLHVNFTFEIIEGGCYTWSLSRDDIVDLEPLYEDTWGHCSRAARVSVSKSCVPPGSVIILAEEVNTGEILRGDVDIDEISSLKVMSTTWRLYLEEAPEAFEVVAYDDQGNTFSTLEGVSFTWTIQNLGNYVDDDPLVTLVRWKDTDYEAPRGVTELESQGLRSNTVLLYGQAMGQSQVTVCLGHICTDFKLNVVASVVLTPAVANIALGDTLRYRVVRARAGRLTIQDVYETLYYMKIPDTSIALLEDSISLVRGAEMGATTVLLMSGSTEVATATLNVVEPHSIKVKLRPSDLLVRGEVFIVHCIVLDKDGHALIAGDEMLIRLTAEGEANVDLLKSTENGTLTEAIAQNAGPLTITARLHSIGGKALMKKVEGQISAEAVDPLEIVPPELYVAWTDHIQDIQLQHYGGGDEAVIWSEIEKADSPISLAPTGVVSIRGLGDVGVRVQLKKYPHVVAFGKVYSAAPEYIQVASSGHARVGKPHHLHVALTATHPVTGELYNFHTCNCDSFTVSLLEGPEPSNVTAATWIEPIEGGCCVLECYWSSRGVSSLRVSRARLGHAARVSVRAAPRLVWPHNAAALVGGTLPVLAEGESLTSQSSEPRVSELGVREGPLPHQYPDVQMFTFKCRRKGDARLELTSQTEEEKESVEFEAACAPHVSRIRLESSDALGNCSGGPKIWLRPGHEASIKVTLLDAVGRELLDELGPKMTWDIEPYHAGLEFKASDRLFVEYHPEYSPVSVPFKYFQTIGADEQAVGWSGVIKANIPEATASIQAKVAAPLKVDPVKLNLAWEGESLTNIATITGGSGRYTVETPSGVSAAAEGGVLAVSAPGPGTYDVVVTDQCVGEKQLVEVNVEEVLSIEIATSRAVGVGNCVPITALVRGISHRYLTASREVEWRVSGGVRVAGGRLCGDAAGAGRVRAARGGVWSPELEVLVFPPLQIVPEKSRLPPGARLQLRHQGGPPSHLATLQYKVVSGVNNVEISQSGTLQGVALGLSKIKLIATDIANIEMDSAEAEVEVVPISGLRVRAATQTLLVGSPAPVWVEAAGLTAASLSTLHPAPRVTFSVRDPTVARLYTTHADDKLERSVAEGLSVRVVPLKSGLVTIDVRVRNMGQVAETRSWDSTIEILAVSDIRTSVDGAPTDLNPGDRLAIASGSTIRLKSMPKSDWKGYSEGAFDVTNNGEVNALKPGHGVIVGFHKDERNNVYRETAIHVEVSLPHYCTVEPSDEDEDAVQLVFRNNLGRKLLSTSSNVSVVSPYVAQVRLPANNVLGSELIVGGLDSNGGLVTFRGTAGGVTVIDEVWLVGSGSGDRILATGGWGVCLEGVGWKSPPGVTVYPGSGVSLALLTKDSSTKHVLRLDRTSITATIHQVPIQKIEFLAGDWPAAFVPLSIEAASLTSGPLLCSEDQRYALEGMQIELPFTCRTKVPHTAEAVLDIVNDRVGCSVIPAAPIMEASEIELCAEWDIYRTCTKVLLLPPIHVSQTKLSLLNPPALFTIHGHPHPLKAVKLTVSPGLKLETVHKENEISVIVKGEVATCGIGWVNVKSKLTAQEIRVEVERECDVACGTLLGALFSLVMPYLSTLVTIASVAGGLLYLQAKYQQKTMTGVRNDPPQTVLPPEATPPSNLTRTRTWSRSPYASNGPAAPVYGDTSVLPDNSFSPNTTRMHSRCQNQNPSIIDVSRLSLLTTPTMRNQYSRSSQQYRPLNLYEDYVMTDDFIHRFL